MTDAPIKPSDLGLSVPGDSWRPGQWDTISRLAMSDKRFLLLEGPPGTGKSLIARALASLLDMRTHVLTGTKQLQGQYSKDGVSAAMGRANFECAIEPIGADAAICTVGGKCEHAGRKGLPGCPYYDQKRVAEAAKEAVFNYAVWLRWVNQTGFRGPELLVADEAHTLKDHVRSFAQVSLSIAAMGRLGLNATHPTGSDFSEWHAWAKGNLPAVRHRWYEMSKHPPTPGNPELMREFHSTHAVYEALKELSAADDDWIVQSHKYGWDFKPVWVHTLTKRLVYEHASQKVLLMSATILNKEVFCSLHGINPDDADFIQLPSFFDRRKRPLYYLPAGRAARNSDNRPLLAAISDAVSRHPDDRVLVHTVADWFAQQAAEALRRGGAGPGRQVLSHTTRDRLDVLQRFRDTPQSVLVSPSMHTGVDLPDELLRAQVISRLPFPDLGDPLIQAQMKNATRDNPLDKGNLAYTYDTAAALIQTYGRIMRSEDDHGATYLLDPAWKWFRHAARDFLPGWFTAAVVAPPAQPAVDSDAYLARIIDDANRQPVR